MVRPILPTKELAANSGCHCGIILQRSPKSQDCFERAEARFDGRLLVTWETMDDLEEFGKLDRDSDSLFRQLQGVKDCQVAILIRQEDAETCSISLRSSNHIDVGVVAKKFGGGGHPGAAGFSSTESLAESRDEVIEHFAAIFQL